MKKLTKQQLTKRSTNSGLTLPAPTEKLCDSWDGQTIAMTALLSNYVADSKLPFEIRCIIDFQLKSGCRISACLNKNGFKIDPRGKITVFEPKTKTSVSFFSVFSEFILKHYGPGIHLFLSYLSRFQIYRIYKKLGIDFTFNDNCKASVCHAPRHLVADLTYQNFGTMESVAKELNHKSLKSTKHYVSKKRK